MAAPAAVHPLRPRFALAVAGVLSLEALAVQTWPAVAVALGLLLLGLAAPRVSPVDWLFGLVARQPASLAPAAPWRAAEALSAALLAVALGLLAASLDTASWALVGVASALALLAAVGLCLACGAVRRMARARDLRAPLGLAGPGPWLVVLTAPGCPRGDVVASRLATVAGGRRVERVDLAERRSARAAAARIVPAALAVGADGRLAAARTGRLGEEDLRAVAEAL
jgi:hypothetical protein